MIGLQDGNDITIFKLVLILVDMADELLDNLISEDMGI